MGASGSTTDLILVVDDDADIRSAIAMVLEQEGYRAATAADGMEALAWLRENPPPCVVLLDLMMPVMDGWQVARAMQADPDLERLPVIIVTASRPPPPYPAAARILKKPIDYDDLLEAVASCRR